MIPTLLTSNPAYRQVTSIIELNIRNLLIQINYIRPQTVRRFVSSACHLSSTKVGITHHRNMSQTMVKPTKSLVAVCQMNCVNDKEKNYISASSLIDEAAGLGAKMIFLPECFDFIGSNKQEAVQAAEPIDGPTISKFRELARKLKVWLSLGGFHQLPPTPVSEGGAKILNAHVVLDDLGEIRSVYHKVHLFNLEIPNVVRLIESESYVAGSKLPEPVQTPIGKIGLGICYDLRFGEMAIAYSKAGADILTYPSSFTVPTGIHHWEPLIRARAIENQCYVIAAAQVGTHNSKRASYGHAMIVDPWGTKIAECSDGVGFALGLIDHEFLSKCRLRLPIWTDRRYDVYADIEPAVDQYKIDDHEYKFQNMIIDSANVFYRTRYSYAFVNHRPVLEGHVLLSPLRVCEKFTDLTKAELADLMQSVQKIEKMLERVHGNNSTTITVQDGPDAGQSVYHVHVHILPRKPTDFGGNIDRIYAELQQHDKSEHAKSHPKLDPSKMSSIASNYRKALSER